MSEFEVKGDELVINMGPQHPSTHGVLRLKLVTDGELVKVVDPVIGYLHRNFEKHSENITYPQVLPYTDRMDYLAAMNCEWGFCIAVERMMEIEVPERVEYIRVIMSELNRIGSHMIAIGTFGLDLGTFTPFLWCFREREYIMDLFEMVCGARLLYNYIWIGGVSHDLPDTFVDKCHKFLDGFEKLIPEVNALMTDNKIFINRLAHLGVLSPEIAYNVGATGPVLRGSGFKWDLRKDDPYSIYDRFDFDIPVGSGAMGTLGDAWDRFYVRLKELDECIKIIRQALDGLPAGDVHEGLPKRIRPKVGTIYSRTENPRGELGYHLISDGSDKPFRLKVRSPAFCNLSLLKHIASGALIADAVAIVGSLDLVLGEIDR